MKTTTSTSAWCIQKTVEYYSVVNGNILEGKYSNIFTEQLFGSESIAKSTLKRGIDESYMGDCVERIDDFMVKEIVGSEGYLITRFEVVESTAAILNGRPIALLPRD
jgi:hypothetical protein